MKIRAYVDYNERSNTRYYRDFTIVDELDYEVNDLEKLIADKSLNYPIHNGSVFEISEVRLDCQQGNSEVYDFDYYVVRKVNIADYHNELEEYEDVDIDDYIDEEYVAVKSR